MNEENKKIEILTDTINTPDEIRDASAEKRKKACGFDPEMWKKQYPGLKENYFDNIQEYCREKDVDENKINKEVLDLAIEVARQVHSTGVENWLKRMESQKELPFIKYFEDGFEPNPIEQENSSQNTPVADMVEEFIVTKKSFWELTNAQISFLQWLIIRGSKHKRGRGRMVIVDEQTINQYILEVLTIRPGFNKAKNYTARFKRFIKVLHEEGYLIRAERLQNYYLINPTLVSTSSTAQAKKQRCEAQLALLNSRRQLKLETVEAILGKRSKAANFKPLLPLVQEKVNGMLKFANIQTIATKCELTIRTEEIVSQDKKTRILKKEIHGFHFKDEQKITESLNFEELKREILSTPRINKKTRNIIENYGAAEISYLIQLARSGQKTTLQDELNQIGLGRKLKISVAEIISNY